MAEPLANVDKITIVSTGDGRTTGASKLTGEMTEIAAQVPALFEALSGMNLKELMTNVKSMAARPNGVSSNGANGSAPAPTAGMLEGKTDGNSN
jgi:flotillin